MNELSPRVFVLEAEEVDEQRNDRRGVQREVEPEWERIHECCWRGRAVRARTRVDLSDETRCEQDERPVNLCDDQGRRERHETKRAFNISNNWRESL